jgi:hypothetical protein
MGMKERLDEWAEEPILTADGFDDCIVGLARRPELIAVAYDVDKMLAQMVEGGMTLEEAREYFEFNVVGAWVGETTPVYIEDYRSFKDVEDKIIENDNSRQSTQDPVQPEEEDTAAGTDGEDVQDEPVHE